MLRCALGRLLRDRALEILQAQDLTGVHRNILSKLINHKATRIDFHNMERICRGLNISLDELFEFDPPLQTKKDATQHE